MAQDNVNSQDAASPDKTPVDIQRTAESEAPTLPSAYETLMKQHRDAIMRIHTLETENQNLMNLLKQTLSGNALSFVDQAATPAVLLSRTQALENRDETIENQPNDQHNQNVSDNSDEATRASSHEVEQLRIQNQTLVGWVSKMDGELQSIKSEHARRRRRNSSRNQKQGFLQRLFGK